MLSVNALRPTGCGDGSADEEKGGSRTLLFSMFCTSICGAQHNMAVVMWCKHGLRLSVSRRMLQANMFAVGHAPHSTSSAA